MWPWPEGADPAAVAAALHRAVGPGNGQALTRQEWLRATAPGTNRLGLLLVLGVTPLQPGISVANTTVMATSDRIRDLAVPRLTPRPPGRRRHTGRHMERPRAPVVRPALTLLWQALGTTAAARALLAVVSATLPAAIALRRRPVELAGVRE
ncbi:hypothetical protein [Streptomyces violarus]|uniref:hypothetical protein n=1 Tax=Streptomyces violarus TaxID=67380 RepID=UPI0021C0F58D|nr:hypothetical protein [Streptomyces violarus]MCT9143669.1 hypothetical protein [Streptomyces violarus]